MDYRSEATYKETRLPVELASTLIADAYRSESFYLDEREQLFGRSWVAVATSSDVREPGQAVVREVGGRSVIITRNRDGDLNGFLNVCRHRGSRLLSEDSLLRAWRIRCPYHAWAYDLDGNCIGTPLFEGSDIPEDMRAAFDMGDVKAFDRADYSLFPVNVNEWGPLVMVSLEPDPTPLEEWMGDLPDRLGGYDLGEWEVQASKAYYIRANWKLIAENFMEYYHLPWVHPELAKVVAGRFMLHVPNAALSVLPTHLFLMILDPVAADRTIERTYLLTHPSTMGAPGAEQALDDLMAFWDHVNVEDIDIVENVQLGISTPEYQGGRMCYRFEEPVHRFQNMVIDRMVGLDRIPEGDEIDQVPMFGD